MGFVRQIIQRNSLWRLPKMKRSNYRLQRRVLRTVAEPERSAHTERASRMEGAIFAVTRKTERPKV